MSLTVKNIGVMQYAGGATVHPKESTNVPFSYGEVGTVTVTVEGRNYTFGPNQSISFADDGIGKLVAAADARLGIVDSRDGAPVVLGGDSGPSVVVRTF